MKTNVGISARTCLAQIRLAAALPVLLVSAFLTACASVQESPKDVTELDKKRATSADQTGSVQTLETPAGFPFWYYPMPKSDRSAVAITWPADLPQLPEGQEATARLGIELMLNGGAGGQPAEKIIADFEDLDAGSRLWVQPQEISGFILTPEAHIDTASSIANLVLTKPNFDAKWFAREKKKLYDQAVERETLIFGLAWNLSREMMLGDHPYKRFWSLLPVEGVDSITLEGVKDWHAESFSTDNLSITVAGNADIDKIGSGIDKVLENMSDHRREAPRAFQVPQVPAKTVLLHQPDATKSAILIIGNLPSHSIDTDIPLNLGLGVLGYGKQSRLFKAVRSGLRAAYGFGAGTFDMTRQHTIMHISGEVDTSKLQQALDETRLTYEKFRTKGIGPLEFPVAKRFYLKNLREELKKPESVAYMLMNAQLNNYGTEHMPTLLSQLDQQSRASVNTFIKEKFPKFDSLLKIIVSADRDAIEGACVIDDIQSWESC